MRIIFIRHGEPDYDNDCLTENGRIQAESTAKRLEGEKISKIYSSTMGRAVETASYTAKTLNLPVKTFDFLREIDWGNPSGDSLLKEGHPWTLADVFMADETNKPENWRDHPYFRDNKCTAYYDMITSKTDEFLASLGYRRKGGRYLCSQKNTETIAVFYHGGTGACMLSHILNLSFPYVLSVLTYGLCSVSIISFPGDAGEISVPRIELFNDLEHVRDERGKKPYYEK